jgi:CBS domain containing-hemolysin-like protein
LLNVSVDADGFDTLGGLVYQQQGRIPSPGDAVMYDGLRIEVVSTAGRRLKRLRVTRLPDKDASPAD